MTRYTQLALMLCVAVAGTAVEARADCDRVSGSIAETSIPSNDPFGRLLGTVTGVLNGASTVFITSPPPNVTSYDVFLTTAGDVLLATGVPTRTPVPGEPGEFISHVDLTVVGGFGRYAEATGTMTFDGRSHTGTMPGTADLVYQGTVCGPNVTGSNRSNLLEDPGFEEDEPPSLGSPGWVSDSFRQTAAFSETHQPRTGAQNGACWTPDYLDCGLYQDVTAPATGTYSLTVFATADRDGGVVGANVNGSSVVSAPVASAAFGDYVAYTMTFSANTGDIIRVWMYSPAVPGYVVIDDVSLLGPSFR
jgi:hypothetical protein